MNLYDLTYLEIIDALRKIDPVHEIIIENEAFILKLILSFADLKEKGLT